MTEELTDNQKLRKAYSQAGTRLREAHRDEFDTYQQEEAAKLGLDWSPRPTQTDKAKAEIERLLDENPSLLDLLVEMLAKRAEATTT